MHLVCIHTLLPSWPCADVFEVTIGTGEGTVDEGMGATKRTIANNIKLRCI